MHYMYPSKINCKKQNYINIHIFRGVTVSEGKHSMLGERLPHMCSWQVLNMKKLLEMCVIKI